MLSQHMTLFIALIIIQCFKVTALQTQTISNIYYQCPPNTQCIVNCSSPNECNNIIINATESISLIISDCNDDCNEMTIYCPQIHINDIDYKCEISGYINSTITDLYIYAISLNDIDITNFYEIKNSTLFCNALNQINEINHCYINEDGNKCLNNNTICDQIPTSSSTSISSSTATPSPTIDGIVIDVDTLILYGGIAVIVIIFCFSCCILLLIGTFCYLRLKHQKQLFDHSISEMIKKQSIDIHELENTALRRNESQIIDETKSPKESQGLIKNNNSLTKFERAKSYSTNSVNSNINDNIMIQSISKQKYLKEERDEKEMEFNILSTKRSPKLQPLPLHSICSESVNLSPPNSPISSSPIPATPIPSSPISTNNTNNNTEASSPVTPGGGPQKPVFKLPKEVTPGQWM